MQKVLFDMGWFPVGPILFFNPLKVSKDTFWVAAGTHVASQLPFIAP